MVVSALFIVRVDIIVANNKVAENEGLGADEVLRTGATIVGRRSELRSPAYPFRTKKWYPLPF
jgi:hypothetical protein